MCTNYRAPHEDFELRELRIEPFSDLYRRRGRCRELRYDAEGIPAGRQALHDRQREF